MMAEFVLENLEILIGMAACLGMALWGIFGNWPDGRQ